MDKCRKVTLNLHNIRKIRNSLDDENTKNLIYALVTSHTDYFSSLLMGVPENTLKLVEKLQNILAKLILIHGKHERCMDVKCQLHCIPSRKRINFKYTCMCIVHSVYLEMLNNF